MPERPDGGAVRDDRRAPFCYQTHDALDVLRENFQGPKRSTALSIYLCLTEAANRNGGAAARDGFSAARKEIAEAAGVSADTLDRYIAEMEAVGIIRRERRRLENVNLPNVWVLVEPGQVPPVAAPMRPGGSRTRAAQGLKELEVQDLKEGKTASSPAAPGLTPPALVLIDGQNLGWNALMDECGIVDVDPRRKEIGEALNGTRTPAPGIRALFWVECVRYAEEHPEHLERLREVVADPERFERALEAAIHAKAARYREVMDGAILTPGALRKWWISVEQMRSARGGLSPEEIERLGSAL